ncbi:MAG: hypothetical protein M3256_07615 [Actinomycetota bacterium]|nr:hypothetical protein [Actinomycetota bacterium]
MGENKKVIVFRATRGDTVGAARYLAESLGLPSAEDTLELLPTGDRSTASEELRLVLQRGVGFHNSDLDRDERAALEVTFRDPTSPLRVLVATTTLAMGVNTPAEAVVIAGLSHPGGVPYSVAEYKNMAGRAGRPGHADAGEAFIIATAETNPGMAWGHYVKGQPEGITSHFLAESTDPQTLALRCLVALGATVQESDLVALLENSFAMWLRKEAGSGGWNVVALRQDIQSLISGSLLDKEPDGHLTLTALGRYAGESGIEVRSVTRLASAMRFAPATLTDSDVVTLAQVTCELDSLYIPANKKSHKEQQRWPMALRELGVDGGVARSLHVGGGDPFVRTKRAVACLLLMSSRPMSEIERILLQHTRDRAAAGHIRQVASRTRDVIEAVFQVASFHGRTVSEEATSDDLGLRLEIGLPAELVRLAQYVGTSLNRGQYLGLHEAGIREPPQLAEAGVDRLSPIVGMEMSEYLARL